MRATIGVALAIALVAIAAVSCGPAGRQAGANSAAPAPSASPSSTASPSETLGAGIKQAPAPQPQAIPVFFSGLPAGTYVTHLHSRCNGSASFHIIVLNSLVVGGGGTGSVLVPSGYFGRGLCVIVYANPSLSRVLTTEAI